MRVAVVGCGYVGLSTGATLAYLGHSVTGLDTDEVKVAGLNGGRLPLYEPGLAELLTLAGLRLRFVSDYREAIPGAEVIVIAVGTPALPGGAADLRQFRGAVGAVRQHLGPEARAIVVKSTVPIGATSEVALHGGGGPSVVFCPEFLRAGSALSDSLYPDRIVVGAEDERGLETVKELYRPILDQTFEPPAFLFRPDGLKSVPLLAVSWASAELSKYAANAFLATKISFINEIATLAEKTGADVTDVARAMGLDSRIGDRFLQAGLGWGGSCFGKDTAELLATARANDVTLPIVHAAREVNYAQRSRVVGLLRAELGPLAGRTVALLGLAFKPGTDDLRDAPAMDVAAELLAEGARVRAHDPVAIARARAERPDLGIEYCDSPEEAARGADAVVLATEWPEYLGLDWSRVKAVWPGAGPLVVDGRNALDREDVEGAGLRYRAFGRVSAATVTAGPVGALPGALDEAVAAASDDAPRRGRGNGARPSRRILLTGAAGFIGSSLAERLVADGHEVIGLDNLITGRRSNLAALEGHPRFRLIAHDVCQPFSLTGPLNWVMHFASPASPPKYLRHSLETLCVNSEGTRHLLELARTKGASFFLASTSEVYGDPEVHPQPETYWGRVNPIGPRSVYDESKRYAEALVMEYHRRGLDTRISRIFNTYGPGMDPEDGRVVSNFIRQALHGEPLTIYGDGTQTRSFQYIDDLIEGIVRLMGVDYSEPVNLGNPGEFTVLELEQLVREVTGTASPIVHGPLPEDDPRQRRPDITLAQRLLGWSPRVQLREGLALTSAFFAKEAGCRATL
jgi:UDPglucose 6-dehydrogenase